MTGSFSVILLYSLQGRWPPLPPLGGRIFRSLAETADTSRCHDPRRGAAPVLWTTGAVNFWWLKRDVGLHPAKRGGIRLAETGPVFVHTNRSDWCVCLYTTKILRLSL